MDSGQEPGCDSIPNDARKLSLKATTGITLAKATSGITLAVSNWLTSLRDFMLESFGCALLASLLPLVSILCMKQAGYDTVISQYYEEGSRFNPPILKDGNITNVPFSFGTRSRYYVDNVGKMSTTIYLPIIMFTIFTPMPILLRAKVMLRPRKQGTVLGAAITGLVVVVIYIAGLRTTKANVQTGGKTRYNTAPAIFMFMYTFIMPLVFVVAQVWTKISLKKWMKTTYLKWYVVIVLALLLESSIATMFNLFVLPFFFSSSKFQRFLIRTLSPIIFLKIGIGVGWKFAVFVKEKTNCDVQSVTVGFLSFYCVVITTLARLMQGSASSFGESLLFEVAATVSELVTAGEGRHE